MTPYALTPLTTRPLHALRRIAAGALSAFALAATAPALAATDPQLPGKGVTVQPIKSSIAEETFQTLLVMKGLQRLGYDVQPIREVEYPTAHLAIGNGDATFMAAHWDPLHADYYRNAGGDTKLWRDNAYSGNAIQGYLIDKKTAEAHGITNLSQLSDPAIAKRFTDQGLEIVGSTPAETTAFQARDNSRWKNLIQTRKITID